VAVHHRTRACGFRAANLSEAPTLVLPSWRARAFCRANQSVAAPTLSSKPGSRAAHRPLRGRQRRASKPLSV
jgi:hypothetical protein